MLDMYMHDASELEGILEPILKLLYTIKYSLGYGIKHEKLARTNLLTRFLSKGQ